MPTYEIDGTFGDFRQLLKDSPGYREILEAHATALGIVVSNVRKQNQRMFFDTNIAIPEDQREHLGLVEV